MTLHYNLNGYADGISLNTVSPWTGAAGVAVLGADGYVDSKSTGAGSVRHPVATNNMEISMIGGTNVTHTELSLAVRVTDHYNYIGVKWINATTLSLGKTISTVFTQSATYVTGTRVAGAELKIRIKANGDCTVFYQGAQVMSANFTELSSVKNVGVVATSGRGDDYATSFSVSETFQDITSINGGSNTVTVGAANTCTVVDYGSAVTSGTLDGVALTAVSNTGFTVPALVDGVETPRLGTRTLALSDGTLTGNRQVTVAVPTGLSAVQLASNFSSGVDSIVYQFSPAAVAGDWIYYDPTKGTVDKYGYYNSSFEGTVTAWHIAQSTSVAREFSIITRDEYTRYGETAYLTTTALGTANDLMVGGIYISALTGSNNSYQFILPALSAGATVPLMGVRTASITDGIVTENYLFNIAPLMTQSFVTLTSVDTGVGFVGNYLTCSVGDQIVFDTPTTLSVVANRVTASGAIQTDYSGTQTMWHIRASDGLVTELTIITPAVGVDVTPSTYTFTDTSNSPLSTIVESNIITVADVAAGQNIPVTITGGEYAVNTGSGFGAWTSANTTVQLGWTIKVRGTSSSQFGTAVNVVLSVGGVGDTFTINTITADVTPNAFNFTSVTNAQLSSTATSASVAITGFSVGSPVPISIANGTYAIDGGAYTATAGNISVGQTVSVRVTTPSTALTPTVATLSIGGVPGTFTATTRAYDVIPTVFTFTPVTNLALNAVTSSNAITVAGIDVGANATIAITGGEYAIDGGAWTSSPGTVQVGQSVATRVTASSAYNTPATATLTIGGIPGAFVATTRPAVTAPTAFSFTAATNAALSSVVESGSITVVGVDSGVNIPVSVTNGEYSFYNGSVWSAFTSISGNVQSGYLVKVRTTSSSSDGQSVNTTLNVGGTTAIFTVSTGAVDLAAANFVFTTVSNTEPNALLVSATITVAGISAGYDTTINITNGEYRIHNGIAWSAYTSIADVVRLGYQVQVRHNASSAFNTAHTTTLDIGGTTGTFVSTTRTAVTLPTVFTLGSQSDVALMSYFESSTITVQGIDVGVPVDLTITDGEYSINNDGWASVDTTVQLGATVKVRVLSSTGFAATASATLTIGGRSSVFSATTRMADTTPASMVFTAASNQTANAVVISNDASVIGMDPNIDVGYSVINGEVSVYNGTAWSAYGATGVIQNGYQIRLRTSAPAFVNQDKVVSFVAGTSTSVWSVDTNSVTVTVDPFTFNAITDATINTTFDSNLITLSGMTKGTLTTVNISGGKYRAFYRDMATGWLTGSTQLPFGCEIRVRVATTNNYNTQHNAVLTIAGYSAPFRVTTKTPNVTPRNFKFNTIANANKSDSYESSIAIIKGFDLGVQATISITNGEYRIDTGSGFGTWTSSPGVAVSGSVVKVRTTSPATAETTKLVTLNVNGTAGVFTVTTRKDPEVYTADDIVNTFSIAPVINAEPKARIESAPFIITGIDESLLIPIVVSNGEYSVDNGPWTTMPGKVKLGSSVRIAGRCKDGYNAVNEVTVAVGSLTRTLMLTTRAELTTLNAVAFYSVTKAPINTEVESNVIVISGVDPTFPVTLSTSGGLKYRVDQGLGFSEWITDDSVVKLGDRIQAAITSSGAYETLRIGTLSLNSTNVQFRVTTGVEPVLSVFSSIARKVTARRYRLTK